MTRIPYIRKLVKKILADSKIPFPPISEETIAKSMGLQLIYYPFPEEISAVFIKDNNLLAIGVNENHHPNRQRFSIAHEIGHYKLGHGDDLFIELSDLDFITKKDTFLSPNFEQEANQFASELLMPIEMLKNDYKDQKDIKALAKRYKVSEQAMLLRLLNLNFL